MWKVLSLTVFITILTASMPALAAYSDDDQDMSSSESMSQAPSQGMPQNQGQVQGQGQAVYQNQTMPQTPGMNPVVSPNQGMSSNGSMSRVNGTERSMGVLNANDMSNSSSPSQDSVIQIQQMGGITYVTGGIGDDEKSAIEALPKEYNLRIISTNKAGSYVGDVQVALVNHHGNQLLDVPGDPLFYAQVPTGTYTIKAMSEGQSQEKKVTLTSNKDMTVHLIW